MRIINMDAVTKDIHFPIQNAVYKEAPDRTWYQKLFKFFTYKRWFEIRKEYVLWVPLLESYIFIPEGFLYDLASVPKLLNGIFNSNGMLLLGALPHDFGYRYECLILVNEMTGEIYTRPFTKSELDGIFESLCAWESKFLKASKLARITLGVAGSIGWKENRKANHILYDEFPGLFAEGVIDERRTADRRKSNGV